MSDFATVQDIISIYGAMPLEEQTRAASIIPVICSTLRYEASKVGKDLDAMIEQDASFANVAKLVTVDIVKRALRQSSNGEPMSQESQTALGYTWSGTYAIPGGGVAQAIMRNDLKRLGLRRQTMGVIEPYGND